MNKQKNFLLNKKNHRWAKLLAGSVIFLLLIALLFVFSSPLKNLFFILSIPVEKAFWAAGESASDYLSSLSQIGQLKKENSNLRRENQRLLSQITLFQAAIAESEARITVSNICEDKGFEFKMAGVIGSDGDDEITLDKGQADGVFEGMPVINQHGVLFGKIFKAYKNFSTVMLISNKNCFVSVEVLEVQEDESDVKTAGMVKGIGGLEIFLDLVLVDDTLNNGDVLVTSSLEGSFPKNLLVGRVQSIEKKDQNPHQQAKVQPFFDISSDNLFVITNYKRQL